MGSHDQLIIKLKIVITCVLLSIIILNNKHELKILSIYQVGYWFVIGSPNPQNDTLIPYRQYGRY